MPVVLRANDEGDCVRRYAPPLRPGQYDYDERGLDLLRRRRRSYAISEQDIVVTQKALGKAGDKESARDLKEIARYFQRLQKAATMWINWIEGNADQRFDQWPTELASELDGEINAYDLALV